jgi:hypothetical protein
VLSEAQSSLPDIEEDLRALDGLFSVLYPTLDELFDLGPEAQVEARPAQAAAPAPPASAPAGGGGVVPVPGVSILPQDDDDDDDDDDKLYKHIQWEEDDPVSTSSGAPAAGALLAALPSSSSWVGSGSGSGSSASHSSAGFTYHDSNMGLISGGGTGFSSSFHSKGADYGALGSRYYCLKIVMPMEPWTDSRAGEDDSEAETFRTVVPMVTELADHLKKFAAVKLAHWEGVLKLHCKHGASADVDDAPSTGAAAAGEDLPMISSSEVDRVLARLTETQVELNHILGGRVKRLLGESKDGRRNERP